ncbi:MAG: hypothetical protein ACFFCV_01565 [Promethearchaeota archaeon]
MANKRTFLIGLLMIFGFGLIIIVPIGVLSVNLSSYGKINYTNLPFEYTPDIPSSIERLNIDIDKGDIEIKYVEPPIDNYMSIYVNLEMTGPGLAGKDYSDFFDINWQNINSPVNFSMKFRSDINQVEVLSLIQNITIVVALRADIIFEIKTTVNEGNIELNIPYGVSVNNLEINTTNGNLFYDLNHCILQGNISGSTNNGDMKFIVNNIQCTQNVIWNLTTQDGKMDLQVYQYIEMGANITGSVFAEFLYDLIYRDQSFKVGALFNFPLTHWESGGQIIDGFDDPLNHPLFPKGFQLISMDFPAENNFELFFYVLEYKINTNNVY